MGVSWFKNKFKQFGTGEKFNDTDDRTLTQKAVHDVNTSNLKTNTIRIITDEASLEDDALRFDNYSKKLAEIISESTPRFAIGIFGDWGTGKTTLMRKIQTQLSFYNDIVVVWFDAWKYENEKHLAVIPFIRTIEIEVENKLVQRLKINKDNNINIDHKITEKWNHVRKALEKTFDAFIESTNLNVVMGIYISAGINLAQFRNILRADAHPIQFQNEQVYHHHTHVTDYLENALSRLRDPKSDGKPENRIVVFIDDLDRCSPDKALELLESLKTFFDIEGFVFVIGMDSNSINTMVKKKYGDDFGKGLEYMQKFVQLPFQVPTWNKGWREDAIADSIVKMISKSLKGSDLLSKFESNKSLIAKAIQPNPRQAKRFINNIIFAMAVFNKEIEKLIVVHALSFRDEWNDFLDLLTPKSAREEFLEEYDIKGFKNKLKSIPNKEALEQFSKDEGIKAEYPSFESNLRIYTELINQGADLMSFLDLSIPILKTIDQMEDYRIALESTKTEYPVGEEEYTKYVGIGESLRDLMGKGNVDEFNRMREQYKDLTLDFTQRRYTVFARSSLKGINLGGVKLRRADFSHSDLREADLKGANLSEAYLEGADLSGADLSEADLSEATLRNTNLNGTKLDRTHISGAGLPISISEARKKGAIFEKSNPPRLLKE